MKTSAQWWAEVKASPEKFNQWLVRQYTGEVTAADRIVALGETYGATGRQARVLEVIAGQERQHAEWIKELLVARGIDPTIEQAEKRYWAEAMTAIEDLDTGTAVAAHAEKMRLERIEVIANDADAPLDVRETFVKILRDELFHERAFREMSSPEAMARTADKHELGMRALGLVA